jgi:hypothetical protein
MATMAFYNVKYRVIRYDDNFKRWGELGEFNFKDEAEGFIQRNRSMDHYQIIKTTITEEIVFDSRADRKYNG